MKVRLTGCLQIASPGLTYIQAEWRHIGHCMVEEEAVAVPII